VAISKNLLNEGEEVVFDVRTHWKALILPFLALILLLAVSVFVDRAIDNGTVSAGVWIIILGLILWLSVWPFLNWLVASYTVTNRRLITRYGVITRLGASAWSTLPVEAGPDAAAYAAVSVIQLALAGGAFAITAGR